MPFNLKDIADQLNNIQGSGNDKQESARLLERLHDLQSLLQDVKELENRVSSIQSAQKSNESEFPEKINIDSSPFKNIAESFRERIKDFESDKTNKQLIGGQKWVRLIKEVKNQLDTSTSDLQKKWRNFVENYLGQTPTDIEKTLVKTPDNKRYLNEYKQTYDSGKGVIFTYQDNGEIDFNNLKAHHKKLQEISKKLDFDIPDALRVFFEKTSGFGFELNNYSDEIKQWLNENDRTGDFVIKARD